MPQNFRTHGDTDRSLASSAVLAEKLQDALGREDRAVIVRLVAELVERRAPFGRQWLQLANIAADHGEISLSLQAIDLFVAACGGGPLAQYHKFDLLARVGAMREAGNLLKTLPESVPDPANNGYSRGSVAMFLGEMDEARNRLEEVTDTWPGMGQAWLPLATVVDFAAEPDVADKLFAAENKMGAVAPAAQAAYYYAAGKAYADLGEHEKAFDAFARGARTKRRLVNFDRSRDRALADQAMDGYTSARIAGLARRQEEPTGRTIFVTGSPRSGTTLVEQILTSHSAVSDGAEINLLRLLWQDLRGLDYPALSRHVAENGTAPAARLWQHLLTERFPKKGRVVDKSTDAGFFLGLVSSLLPDAPVIWMRRDPLDCAWSCFRTHFLAGLEWSYDLEDIAHHFRQTDRLLTFWREVLGDRLLVVPYESLVSEPEPWIRRILAHCGLSEEAQAFTPHTNGRPVATSSMMQVRQPINRKGVGSSDPYREWLEPFERAYYS